MLTSALQQERFTDRHVDFSFAKAAWHLGVALHVPRQGRPEGWSITGGGQGGEHWRVDGPTGQGLWRHPLIPCHHTRGDHVLK